MGRRELRFCFCVWRKKRILKEDKIKVDEK